jgi:ethanolamine utilization cobalamin adenosyltransferase
MHPGGEEKGEDYCNRKPWGLKVARPKGSQLTPYSAPHFQEDTWVHTQATNTKQGWAVHTHTKQGWAAHTHTHTHTHLQFCCTQSLWHSSSGSQSYTHHLQNRWGWGLHLST